MSTLIYVPSEGFDNAPIAIVGEAPGKEEEKQGRPFVGRSGQLVRTVLARANVAPEHVRITNAVCVRPTYTNGENRTPTGEEIKAWLPHLKKEIQGAKIVITLGRIAEAAVGQLEVTWQQRHGLYHPAYILREPGLKEQWGDAFVEVLNSYNSYTLITGE